MRFELTKREPMRYNEREENTIYSVDDDNEDKKSETGFSQVTVFIGTADKRQQQRYQLFSFPFPRVSIKSLSAERSYTNFYIFIICLSIGFQALLCLRFSFFFRSTDDTFLLSCSTAFKRTIEQMNEYSR